VNSSSVSHVRFKLMTAFFSQVALFSLKKTFLMISGAITPHTGQIGTEVSDTCSLN